MFLQPVLNLLNAGGPLLGGGPLEFPETLPNLELWFDADDAGTITEVGGEVSQWNDKSGNGRNVLQGVADDQPNIDTLGGLSTIFFDGDDALSLSGLSVPMSPMTVFGVIAPTDATGTKYAWSIQALTQYVRQQTANLLANHNASAGDACTVTATSVLSALSPIAFIVREQDSTTGVIETDDGTTGTDAIVGTLQTTITTLNVGARDSSGRDGWDGHIMEIGSYSQRLPDADKDDLMDYLKTKWSL